MSLCSIASSAVLAPVERLAAAMARAVSAAASAAADAADLRSPAADAAEDSDALCATVLQHNRDANTHISDAAAAATDADDAADDAAAAFAAIGDLDPPADRPQAVAQAYLAREAADAAYAAATNARTAATDAASSAAAAAAALLDLPALTDAANAANFGATRLARAAANANHAAQEYARILQLAPHTQAATDAAAAADAAQATALAARDANDNAEDPLLAPPSADAVGAASTHADEAEADAADAVFDAIRALALLVRRSLVDLPAYVDAPTDFDATNAASARREDAVSAAEDADSAVADAKNKADDADEQRSLAVAAATTQPDVSLAAAAARAAAEAAATAAADARTAAFTTAAAAAADARAAATAARTAADDLHGALLRAQSAAAAAKENAAARTALAAETETAAAAAETLAALALLLPAAAAAAAADARADADSINAAALSAESNAAAADDAVHESTSAAASADADAEADAKEAERLATAAELACATNNAASTSAASAVAAADAAASAAAAAAAKYAPAMRAWYDAAPDAAALIGAAGAPVAADGEAVFAWLDKSGLGNHLYNVGGDAAAANNRNVAYSTFAHGRAVDTSGTLGGGAGAGAANTEDHTGFKTTAGLDAPPPVFANAITVFAVTARIVGAAGAGAAGGGGGAGGALGGGLVAKTNAQVAAPFDVYGTARRRGRYALPAADADNVAAAANYDAATNFGAYTTGPDGGATDASGACEPVCFALTLGAPDDPAFREYVNGNAADSLAVDGDVPWADNVHTALHLATRADKATWAFRLLHEVIVYDMPVSDALRQAVEGYLAWKWGMQDSLPATHPYAAGRPVVADGASAAAVDFAPPKTQAEFALVSPLLAVAAVDPRTQANLKGWYDAADANTLRNAAGDTAVVDDPVFSWLDKSGLEHKMNNRGGAGAGSNNKNFLYPTAYGRAVDTSGRRSSTVNKQNTLYTGFITANTANTPRFLHSVAVFAVFSAIVGAGGSDSPGLVSKFLEQTAGGGSTVYTGFDMRGTARVRGNGTATFSSATSAFDLGAGAPGDKVNSAAPPACVAFVFGAQDASAAYAEFANGTQVAAAAFSPPPATTTPATPAWTDSTAAALCLATRADRVTWAYEHLYEVLVYDMPITTPMRQAIEGYLMWKWNLQAGLPANHPYKAGRPVVSSGGGAPVDFAPPKTARGFAPPVAYVDPNTPAQLKGWYDAADGNTLLDAAGTPVVADGQSVFTWQDKSGLGYHLTNVGGPDAGANNRNIANTMRFGRTVDTSGKSFTGGATNTQGHTGFCTGTGSNAPPLAHDLTVFVVSSCLVGLGDAGGGALVSKTRWSTNSTPAPFDIYAATRTRGDGNGAGTSITAANYNAATNASTYTPTVTSGTGAPVCVAFTFGAPDASTAREYVNGNAASTYALSSGAAAWADVASAPLYLATRADKATWSFRHLYEVLVYDMSLSNDMRQAIEGYLMWKCRLQTSLPATHPFKAGRPVVSSQPGAADFVPPKTAALFQQPVVFVDPNATAQLKGWYDAADGNSLRNAAGSVVADGQPVFTWQDKSGLGYHLANMGGPDAGASNRNIANTTSYGRMVDTSGLSFTGGAANTQNHTGFSSGTGSNAPPLANDLTVFAVSSCLVGLGDSGYGATVTKTLAQKPAPFDIYGTTRIRGNGAKEAYITVNYNTITNAGAYTPTVTSGNVGAPVCIALTYGAPAASATVYEYVNGNASSAYAGGAAWGDDTGAPLCLATRADKYTWTFRHMYEVLVYDMPLTNDMRQAIEGYLMWKWNLQASLPASHPYKTGRPVVSAQAGAADFAPPKTAALFQQPVAYVDPNTPAQLKGWYDAADGNSLLSATGTVVADGQSVFTWRDKSGLGYHLSNVGGPNVGASNRNIANTTSYGRTVDTSGKSFAGGAANTQNNTGFCTGTGPGGAPPIANDLTVFVVSSCLVGLGDTGGGALVSKTRTANGAPAPFDIYAASRTRGDGTGAGTSVTATNYNAATNAGAYTPTVASGSVGAPVCFAFTFGAPAAGSASEYVNGNAAGTYALSSAAWGDDAGAPLFLATRADKATWSFRHLYEVLVYDMPVSDEMRQAIEGYLMWKWKLQASLPAGHPYKTGKPVVSAGAANFVPPKTAALFQQPVAYVPDVMDAYYAAAYSAHNADNYNAATKTFTDLSPNGRHVTFDAGTAPTRIAVAANGAASLGATNAFAAVQAAGTDRATWIPAGTRAFGSNFTIVVVSRRTNGTDTGSMFGPGVTDLVCGFWDGRSGVAYYTASGWGTDGYVDRHGQNWFICVLNSGSLRTNGTHRSAYAIAPAFPSVALFLNPVTGSRSGCAGQVGEFMLLPYLLTDADTFRLEARLAAKYGIAVPPRPAMLLDAADAASFSFAAADSTLVAGYKNVTQWRDGSASALVFDTQFGTLNSASVGYPLYDSANRRLFFPHGWLRVVAPYTASNMPGFLRCAASLPAAGSGAPIAAVNADPAGAVLYVVLQNDVTGSYIGAPFQMSGAPNAGVSHYQNIYEYYSTQNSSNSTVYVTALAKPNVRGNFNVGFSLRTRHVYKMVAARTSSSAATYTYTYIGLDKTKTLAAQNKYIAAPFAGDAIGLDANYMTVGFAQSDTYRGYVHEVRIYAETLTSGQQSAVEAELLAKWGV